MIPNSQRPIHDFQPIPRYEHILTALAFGVTDDLIAFQGWSILIQAQQVLVSATQFIVDLNKCLSSQSGMHYMFERMQQLDSWANSVLGQTEILPVASQEPDFGDRLETTTARTIRAISRIKLSRYSTSISSFPKMRVLIDSQCPNQNPPLQSIFRYPNLHQTPL